MMPQYAYRLFRAIPSLKHLFVPSSFFFEFSHAHFPLLVQRKLRNYMNPVFALGVATTFELGVFIVSDPQSSSMFILEGQCPRS
ncbi:unnamed protein product [Ectocarpus sp. 12 AP-2014]